ncbi:MAG TPA: hypothetical protein PK583_00095 [Gammaproteobacteria bacterium]|nr:hypothetical protein [Gammaproteobacteria bacterium]
MKTPEQQAQEYLYTCQKEDFKFPVRALQNAFLAGHAAGKQEAERRIWAEISKYQYQVLVPALQRIIFGDGKV